MTSLMLSVALLFSAFPQETGQNTPQRTDGKMQTQKIDGEWTAVYVEMDGKNLESKGFTNVQIKNNVITCSHEGKEKSWRLEFGPHHMVRSTEQGGDRTATSTTTNDTTTQQPREGIKGGHTHYGVYIASKDFLCLSFDRGNDSRFRAGDGREGNRPGTQTGTQPSTQPVNPGQPGVQNQQGTQQPGAQPRQAQPGSTNASMYWQSEGPRGSALVLILRRASTGTAEPTR